MLKIILPSSEKTLSIKYTRYRKQIDDTYDDVEIKALMELVDSEETKKLSGLLESAWFDLETKANEMVKLTQCEEEREEILDWVREEQYNQCNKAVKDRVAVKKQLSEKLCKLNIHETSEKDLGERVDLIVPELSENANLEESDEWWHKLDTNVNTCYKSQRNFPDK